MGYSVIFGTLCSGIGGADLGLIRLGWDCAWQVERDPFKCAVLKRQWPTINRRSDVGDLVDLVELPPVDLVHCEPQEPEPWAVDPVLAWVRSARPPRFIIDIATGHESSRSYGDIFWALHRSGYSVAGGIVQYVSGVVLADRRLAAQPRSRVVVVAVLDPVTLPVVAQAASIRFGDVSIAEAICSRETEIAVEDLERARGFPAGWSCCCARDPCTCGWARHQAVREATAPPLATYIGELFAATLSKSQQLSSRLAT